MQGYKRTTVKVCLSIILVLTLGVWWFWPYIQAAPSIISAFSAKEYCSCRFVSKLPSQYCLSMIEEWIPISQLIEDNANHRIEAQALGRNNHAHFINPQLGCVLE